MNTNKSRRLTAEEEYMLRLLVSEAIKQRRNLGISQRELAEWCEMPQSSIARFETMKTTPNLRTVLRIMHYLGMSISVDPKKAQGIKAENHLLREIAAGEKSGEEEGWISHDEIKKHFDL